MPWNSLCVKQSVFVLRTEPCPQSLVGALAPEGLFHGGLPLEGEQERR